MSSHRRAPGVPDVPPFRGGGGGPLQARGVPNQRVSSPDRGYPIDLKSRPAPPKTAMPPPRTTTQGSSQRSTQHQHQRTPVSNTSRSEKTRSGQSGAEGSRESEPRSSSRLANEKKRDYKDPPFIGPWKLGKLIGQGASGRVRHAVHTTSGLQAAIKIVPKQILGSSRMSIRDVSAKQDKMTLGIEREIVIMKLIEHPNVLGLMDVYETSKELFLILEYVAGGELFDYLVSKGRLRPPEARAYFRQIIFGLHYCHSFNICHRDLKPENLLLDGSKRIVKVADFGMAALQPSEKMLETSCGSPHYASPEIVSGKSYKGTASDIWSCGIILFALLCGRLPFDDPNIQTLLGKVRLGKFDMPDYIEGQAKDLIWRMLTVDPEQRIRMRDIMRHPWFTDNGSLSNTNPVSTDLDKLAEEEMDLYNLDLDILSNLKTLWPELSQQDIVNQLTSKGPNWQKTFYSLLVQHRENYSGDDDEDDDEEGQEILAAPTTGKPSNSLGLSLGITTQQSKSPAVPTVSLPKPSVQRDAPAAPSTEHQRRPDAPASTSPRPISMMSPVLNASPVRPLSPSRPVSMDAPRSPTRLQQSPLPQPPVLQFVNENGRASHGGGSAHSSPMTRRPLPSPTQSPQQSPTKTLNSPVTGFGSVKHAQQALQARQQRETASEAYANSPVRPKPGRVGSESAAQPTTPSRSRQRSSSVADDTTPKQVVQQPPRPSSRAAATRPRSVQGQHVNEDYLPGGQLPSGQMDSANMQRFFREIADELASIRVVGERPISLQRKLEQLERMAAQVRSDARSGSPRRSSRRDDDPMSQFDDADDDLEDGDQYSVRSGGTASDASGQPYTPSTPLTEPMTSPQLRAAPLSVAEKEATGRLPASVLASSAQGSRTTSVQSTSSNTSSSGGSTLGRRRSLLLGRIKSQKKTPQAPPIAVQTHNASVAYERLQEAGVQQQQSRLQSKNPGLGLDLASPALGQLDMPSSVKSPTLSTYSNRSSAPPTPSTPGSVLMTPGSRSSSSHSSPKQSWFAGLFNWKPATCTLMSVENFSVTHMEMKRLLLGCGARVFVEDSENAGVLKCSLAEVKGYEQASAGHAGSTSKPLRFRVEFQILPMSSMTSPVIGTPRSAASPAFGASSSGPGVQSYATSVTLVQEKGSLSTFKQIYHALRDAWTLDTAPGSVAASPAFSDVTSSSKASAAYSPAVAQVGLGVSIRGGGSSTAGSERSASSATGSRFR